jgi:cation transport ATPase
MAREKKAISANRQPPDKIKVPFNHSGRKIDLEGGRLLLRDDRLFDDGDQGVRELVDRVFVAPEVRAVVLRRDRGQIRIELSPYADGSEVWPRIAQLLRGSRPERRRAKELDLVGPSTGLGVRVSRAGDALTTFRVSRLARETLRIGHPLLRRRDVRHRFGELLRSIHGVEGVKLAGLWASAMITYDPGLIEPEQLLRLLENSWEILISGPKPPSRPKKLALAGGLLAFSFYAQFLNPVLLPWAVAAVLAYSSPNLFGAIRDLARGRVGLSALYSAGLGFLLWTRMPFASSVMSVLSQTWPALANVLAHRSERRLFGEQRRRLAWARRADGKGGEAVVDIGDLQADHLIAVRRGDFIPADGIVVEGLAAVEEDMLTGLRAAIDKLPGDKVYAGSYLRDGALVLRALRAGRATSAAALAHVLPHGPLADLPSSREAERIANRNAKPALLLSAGLLLLTRTPRLAQMALRPDYATAPRLSAHLSALTALAEAFSHGVLARRPAALERLLTSDLYVFDDGVDFGAQLPGVAEVIASNRSGGQDTVLLAAAALNGHDDPRLHALRRRGERFGAAPLRAHGRRHHAGAISFWDDDGGGVIVASPAYAAQENLSAASTPVEQALASLAAEAGKLDLPPELRPLVVARDGKVIGIIRFSPDGGSRIAAAIAQLREHDSEARFVHISSLSQARAEARAEEIGFDATFGDLDAAGKVEAIKSLSPHAIWVGDGADPASAPARAAAFISLSLSGLDNLPQDQADIVLLRGDLHALAAARRAARAHIGRLRADYRTVYIANLVALAGGFTAGFGSLRAGLTSNLGSALVFLARLRTLSVVGEEAARFAALRRTPLPVLPPPAARQA